ncbi:peptidoglycan-binding protein [Streptomyces sp. NPDC059695]|uniref:peptidoglycan-binding protein n=1 Tax=Streptomyces sp. NPDC059695 TaxID=3346910 RepID=UPI00367C1A3B
MTQDEGAVAVVEHVTVVGRPAGPEPEERAAEPGGVARRRRWVLAVAVGAVLATTGGLGAALLVKSPAQAAAEAAAPAPDVLTAPVEHRVLTSSVITRGEVVADQTVDVVPQVPAGQGAAHSVITKLPVRAGDTVRPGQVLMEVSGRLVFALKGSLPVYRDLRPGSTGDDVRQLQRALAELGHPVGTDAEGRFGHGTKAALDALYRTMGYDPVSATQEGGNDPVGDARDRVTAAERALEDAADAAGSGDAADAAGSGDAPRPSASASASAAPPASDDGGAARRKAVDRAREDLAAARTKLAAAEAAAGPMLPAAEVVFLKSFPARVDSVAARVGGEATGTAMKLSAGRLVVHARVPEYQKDLIRPGSEAEIYSEVTGASAEGRVTGVSDAPLQAGATGGEGQGAQGGAAQTGPGLTGRLVEITPGTPLAADLTGQDVRVTVVAASTAGKALVVPITAISSGADGRTTVTVAEPGGGRRRVEIRTSTAGDGYVAVAPTGGAALAPGEQVITGVTRERSTP